MSSEFYTPTPVNEMSSEGSVMKERLAPFEDELLKFTNVMKGWQMRKFILDPELGQLTYYLLSDKSGSVHNIASNNESNNEVKVGTNESTGNSDATAATVVNDWKRESTSSSQASVGMMNPRGCQYLSGAMVIPASEDSQTFTIEFASGLSFKLRATNARHRQMWVDKTRAVISMHDRALASAINPLVEHRHNKQIQKQKNSKNRISDDISYGNNCTILASSFQTVQTQLETSYDSCFTLHEHIDSKVRCLRFKELRLNLSDDSSKAKREEIDGEIKELLKLKAFGLAGIRSLEEALDILKTCHIFVKNEKNIKK